MFINSGQFNRKQMSTFWSTLCIKV